ncbi:MAG: T9SS type A sorting domain-containing protein [Chitinophagales bacterium]
MKKIIILILLFYVSSSIIAQNQDSKYFIKHYDWNRTDYVSDIYAKDDSTYFLTIVSRNLNEPWYNIGIIVNNDGAITKSNNYQYDTLSLVAGMISPLKNNFILSGAVLELNGNALYNHYSFVDNMGNILHKSIADTTDYYSFIRGFLPNNNGYLVNGVHIDKVANIWSPRIITMNQDFEVTSITTYFDYKLNSHFTDIKPVPNEEGFFYVYGTKGWSLGSGDLMLLKMDNTGNRLWEETYNLDEITGENGQLGGEDLAGQMLITQDGGFLLMAAAKLALGHRGYFLKLNNEREIEWTNDDRLFNKAGPTDAYELLDGSIICTGVYFWNGYDLETDMTRSDIDIQIAKIDNKGATLWQRTYGDLAHTDTGFGMVLTNNRLDGKDGFILVGRANKDFGEADAYLVKTNCMGLLTEPKTSFSAEQDPDQALTYHFTNQSQYVYPDSIDGGHFLWDFGDGTTSEELHPSHSYANKGESRIVTLTAIVCSDTSRFDIKVITGEEIVGIEGVDGLPAFSFKMYPNPVSNGQVRIDYDLPKEGLLQLYDLQGKLMVNCQLLMVNDWVELDLGDLESGMYLYRLVSYGRTLKSGKLVVED